MRGGLGVTEWFTVGEAQSAGAHSSGRHRGADSWDPDKCLSEGNDPTTVEAALMFSDSEMSAVAPAPTESHTWKNRLLLRLTKKDESFAAYDANSVLLQAYQPCTTPLLWPIIFWKSAFKWAIRNIDNYALKFKTRHK